MPHPTPIQWNAYPALLAATALVGGIAGATALPHLSAWVWLAVALAGAVAAGLMIGLPRRRLVTLRPLWGLVALGVSVAALGAARTTSSLQVAPTDIAALLPAQADIDNVALSGNVEGAAEQTIRGARFTLQLDTLLHGGDTLSIGGAVRVFLRPSRWDTSATFPVVRQGDRVRIEGRLQAPPAQRNPADFDYGAYLRQRGVGGIVSVDDPDRVVITHRPHSTIARIAAFRADVTRQIDQHVGARESRSVLRALLIGDRGRISQDTRDQFASTGLLHLLAISGLHVLLVGMVVYELLRPVLIRCGLSWQQAEWVRAVATVMLLGSFALVTGGRPSVVRAVIMAGLFIGANGLQRTTRSLNTLGVAALVLLLHRPLALYDVGFQLSFAAVAAIVSLNPGLQLIIPRRWRNGWRHQISSLITVSAAATAGTMPVLLAHFGYVSFAGLLLNVVAIPLTALALLSGLCMVAAGGWGLLAGPFGAGADVLTRWLTSTAALGESWFGWAAINTTVGDPLTLASLVTGVVAMAHWGHPRRRWALVAATLLLATSGLWLDTVRKAGPDPLDVIFFDVGQGDAALVSFPNGRHLLVDAGPRSPFVNTGADTIVPHLQRYGIDRLDAVLISHADSDHLGGLPGVLRAVPVGRVIMNAPRERTDLTGEVRALLDSLELVPQPVAGGDTLDVDPSVHVQILGPSPNRSAALDDNDASIVVSLVHGSQQILFAGDAETAAERWLVATYGDLLRSDIVKVGHHGSSTSSTEGFVQAVASEGGLAVISAGRRNAFGFPHPQVVRRWEDFGVDVTTTAERGAVWIRSTGNEHQRVHWRKPFPSRP